MLSSNKNLARILCAMCLRIFLLKWKNYSLIKAQKFENYWEFAPLPLHYFVVFQSEASKATSKAKNVFLRGMSNNQLVVELPKSHLISNGY